MIKKQETDCLLLFVDKSVGICYKNGNFNES